MRQMKIVCNKCGREVTNEDILTVEKRWGYFSNNKDNEIMRLFRKLNKDRNITIIQVTHSKAVAEFGNKIIYLEDGQIVDKNATTDEKKEEVVVESKEEVKTEEKPVMVKEKVEEETVKEAGDAVDEEIL